MLCKVAFLCFRCNGGGGDAVFDVSNLGEDGSLNFLLSEYEAKMEPGHLTMRRLCDLSKLGELVSFVLSELAGSRDTRSESVFDNGVLLKDWSTDCVFAIHTSCEHDSIACEALAHLTVDRDVSIVRYVCSTLVTRAAHVIAVLLGAAIDSLEDAAPRTRGRGSFVIRGPAHVVMSDPRLKAEHLAHLRQSVSYYVQDCVLNRIVSIR